MTTLYIVCLYGRCVAAFERQDMAEKYRVRLAVQRYFVPEFENIFRLDNCPKTELLKVQFEPLIQGFRFLDCPYTIVRDSDKQLSLADDDDLPF